MPDRLPPSAAQAIFPNLPSGTPDVVQQRQQPRLAEALHPALLPRPPTPPKRELRLPTGRELDQRCDEIPGFEAGLAAMGLRRVRRR